MIILHKGHALLADVTHDVIYVLLVMNKTGAKRSIR